MNPPTNPHRDRAARRLALALWTPVLAFTPAAHAYVDPGTGSLILQGLVAAIAGISVTVGLYWERIKAFVRRDRDDLGREDDPDERADDSSGSSKRKCDDD